MPLRVARAFDRLRDALTTPEWERGASASPGVVVFRPPGRHGRCWCVLSYDAHAEAALLNALLPVRCPAERRDAVAELCMRVNRRLALGRLGLDPDTGDVSFQMAWPECMVGATIVPFVELFVTLLDRHVPATIMVIEAGVAPTLAVAGIEASASRLAWQ